MTTQVANSQLVRFISPPCVYRLKFPKCQMPGMSLFPPIVKPTGSWVIVLTLFHFLRGIYPVEPWPKNEQDERLVFNVTFI